MRGRPLVVMGLMLTVIGAGRGVAHAQERYSARVILSGCVASGTNGTQFLSNILLSGPDADSMPPAAVYQIEPKSLKSYAGRQIEVSGIARVNTADVAKVWLQTRADGTTSMSVKTGWRTSTTILPATSPMARLTAFRPGRALETQFDRVKFETETISVVRDWC
jgi:hypothetical protein